MSFALDSITNLTLTVIRVRFTLDPKVVSEFNPDDALNPSNYALTGPGLNSIISVIPAFGDSQAVDVTTSVPLTLGPWMVTVSNIQSTFNDPLTPPVHLSFLVTPPTFSLVALVQNGIESLRLTFSTPPIQINVEGLHDALNPANYTIVGPRPSPSIRPSPNLISSVVSAKGDPYSVDVYLTKPLTKGAWTLKVNNVEAA